MSDPAGTSDTIFALSSGKPPAGLAVIRLSGPDVGTVLTRLAGSLPPARLARFSHFRSEDGTTLDHGIVINFPGPASFTGEDCGELHVHGGRAVVNAFLVELGRIHGLRPAEPGEFTRRALSNGKIDLLGAESLADIISAETQEQRRFAMANSGGIHASIYRHWREKLVDIRALIESAIDFSDESDVPADVANRVGPEVAELSRALAEHIANYRHSEIIREGFRVVIAGPPNAGKSSLINALARRDVAIVSDEPGTTRDLIEVSLEIGGLKVVVTDTAGIRDAAGGRVEAEGIARSHRAIADAHMVLWLSELGTKRPDGAKVSLKSNAVRLHIWTKADIFHADADRGVRDQDVVISAHTGSGLERLLSAIRVEASAALGRVSGPAPFNERQLFELTRAGDALNRCLGLLGDLELAAEEIRIAGRALSRLIGEIDVDEVLGAVFSKFCIGK